MKKALLVLVGAIAWSLGIVDVSSAINNEFLFIQGLKGESKAPGRTDWTNIRSFSLAHGLPGALGVTATTSKILFQPLVVVKFTDSLSPALAFAAASGRPFTTAVVEVSTAGDINAVFLRLELIDVRIAEYAAAGNTSGDFPTEELKLSYSSIRWTTYKIGPDGRQAGPPFVGGWDVVNNKSF